MIAGMVMVMHAHRRGLARTHILAAAAILVLIAVALSVIQRGPEGEGSEGLLIVVAYPGLEDDVEAITCPGDRVVSLYPPGTDPHDLQLDPAKARLVEEADVVVTMGHTPVDLKAGELARGRVVNVLDTPGLLVLQLPGDGVNPHYPIYHPDNYILFIHRLAQALEEASAVKGIDAGRGCSYTGNAILVVERVLEVADAYQGKLGGLEAVVDLPAAQYPAVWLGAEVRLIVASGHGHAGEALDPGVLGEARRLLSGGAVAFVTVDDGGAPVSRVGEWLLEEAGDSGARVVLIRAPYGEGSVLDKLLFIAGQLGDNS